MQEITPMIDSVGFWDPEADIDLIVWDIETSGFKAPQAKILEIGAIIVRGDYVERMRWVLNNGIDIDEKINEINGFTSEICETEGRDPAKCLEEFLPILKRAKRNVTHNGLSFDIPFLVAYASDLMGWTPEQTEAATKLLRSTAYDTAVHVKAGKLGNRQLNGESFLLFADRVMRTVAKGVKYNLGLCCDEMGVDKSKITLHRALGDCEMTYEVYKKLTTTK